MFIKTLSFFFPLGCYSKSYSKKIQSVKYIQQCRFATIIPLYSIFNVFVKLHVEIIYILLDLLNATCEVIFPYYPSRPAC